MKKIKFILYLLIFTILSGCGTSYKHSFDCPPNKGMRCSSLNQVYDKITPEAGFRDYFDASTTENKTSRSKYNVIPKPAYPAYYGKDGKIIYRIPEVVYPVWINDYITDKGDYVPAHKVFIVIKNNNWHSR